VGGVRHFALGVTFGPATSVDTRAPQTAKIDIQANPPSDVLLSGLCFSASCEFGTQSQLTASFTSPRKQVGMFVGKTSSATATAVTLKAFDAHNQLVGQKQATLESGAGVHTPFVFALGDTTATITRVIVTAATPFRVDDFAFS
jgi:hypothetical protein